MLSLNNFADEVAVDANDETWGSDHLPIFVTLNIEKIS